MTKGTTMDEGLRSAVVKENTVKIAKALLEHQRENRLSRKAYRPDRIFKRLLTYGKLQKLAGIKAPPVRIGYYLGELARACARNHVPPLNALVVNGKRLAPGKSYEGAGIDPDWKLDAYAALIWRYPEGFLDCLLSEPT